MVVIFCWTYPRTRSTALEKCLSRVVYTLHEPFSVGYYVGQGSIKTMDSMDFDATVEKIRNAEKEHGKVFIKELAYCVIRQWKEFMKHFEFFRACKHVYLVRHPRETIPSLIYQMKRVYGQDCSLERIGRAVGIEDLRRMTGLLPMMHRVESEKLVESSRNAIHELCRKIDLPYQEDMLEWDKGPLSDWNVWEVQGWHDDARSTTTFKKIDKDYSHLADSPEAKDLISKQLDAYESLLRVESDKKNSCH